MICVSDPVLKERTRDTVLFDIGTHSHGISLLFETSFAKGTVLKGTV
jgi:hypothetical protein